MWTAPRRIPVWRLNSHKVEWNISFTVPVLISASLVSRSGTFGSFCIILYILPPLQFAGCPSWVALLKDI